jgi:hypothetical protein
MSDNPGAAQRSHQTPPGGQAQDPGSKTTSAQGPIDTGNPSVPALDPSGRGTGSHADLTPSLKNQPAIKPIDATTPVPPGYPQGPPPSIP